MLTISSFRSSPRRTSPGSAFKPGLAAPPPRCGRARRWLLRLTLALLALPAGPALSQPGDAAFCRQYAEFAATVAADAIEIQPLCNQPGRGVHNSRSMHMSWCARTPQEEVEGAATHIQRLASRCTNGALAMPQEYGGHNIAGNERFEQPYAQVRQWEVRSASSGRSLMYCVAVLTEGDRQIRLGHDLVMPGGGGQWQLAIPVRSAPDWEGTLRVDNGRGYQMSGAVAGNWTIAWLRQQDLQLLRDGRSAVLRIGARDYPITLQSLAAAILKVEECRNRRGRTS